MNSSFRAAGSTPGKRVKSAYTVQGMTCESCENAITEKISSVPGIVSVKASRQKGNVEITAHRNFTLSELRQALSDLPKYKVLAETKTLGSEQPRQTNDQINKVKKSFYETYKPLWVLFLFIFLVSLACQVRLGSFDFHLFINHLMAGFFIGFSFFKFLDLKAFAESFSSYDPIAKRWLNYGYVYPFLELALGLLFTSGVALRAANVLTVIILSLTSVGVFQRLRSKSQFQCACLGANFNLPLSNVTIAENLAMILMAVFHLVS